MPSGSFGVSSWITKTWTSQLLDNNLGNFKSGDDYSWGLLDWTEENTDDETQAYVRVDILDSSGTVLVGNLIKQVGGVDLSSYGAISSTADIKVKFKLFSLTKQPIVSDISLDRKVVW